MDVQHQKGNPPNIPKDHIDNHQTLRQPSSTTDLLTSSFYTSKIYRDS